MSNLQLIILLLHLLNEEDTPSQSFNLDYWKYITFDHIFWTKEIQIMSHYIKNQYRLGELLTQLYLTV